MHINTRIYLAIQKVNFVTIVTTWNAAAKSSFWWIISTFFFLFFLALTMVQCYTSNYTGYTILTHQWASTSRFYSGTVIVHCLVYGYAATEHACSNKPWVSMVVKMLLDDNIQQIAKGCQSQVIWSSSTALSSWHSADFCWRRRPRWTAINRSWRCRREFNRAHGISCLELPKQLFISPT